jgi:hypothetical protein
MNVPFPQAQMLAHSADLLREAQLRATRAQVRRTRRRHRLALVQRVRRLAQP